MVDIIKSLPSVPTSFASNSQNLRYNPSSQQVSLPVLLSHVQNISQNDRLKNLYTKRWIGPCPSNPSPLLDVSKSPYSLYRKIMYQELSRPYPTAVDANVSLKNKQQRNTNKDTTKTKVTATTTTTTAIEGTNNPSQSFTNTVDVQSSRLFDSLSKHFTIKAEPLRPSNSFTNSSTTTSTSWQKYWASTHVQRRREKANEPDPEPVLYRPKREPSIPGQTHFVVLRDSPYPNSEHHTDSRTPSTPPSSCSPTKLSNTTTCEQPIPTTFDQQIPPTNDQQIPATTDKKISTTKTDGIKKETNRIALIEFVASSLIPISNDINPLTNVSQTSTIILLKSTDKLEEKSLLSASASSSAFKSDSQIIEDIADAQDDLIPLTSKVYNLSLQTEPPKPRKSSARRRRKTRSKSKEKKERKRSPSASKRKRQTSANKPKRSSLSTLMTTTSLSKFPQRTWDEPYVGVRFDPPTPPCSPSLFRWPQDDPDDTDTVVTSEIYEQNSTVKGLESFTF